MQSRAPAWKARLLLIILALFAAFFFWDGYHKEKSVADGMFSLVWQSATFALGWWFFFGNHNKGNKAR